MYIFLLALALFLAFLILLITGIVKQKRKLIYLSLIALGLSIAGGLCIGALIAKKTYRVIKTAENPFKKRTGIEIYSALFDEPKTNCVRVNNKQDAYIPRIDCCVWLEFSTCPEELERIITTKKLMPLRSQAQLIGDSVVMVLDNIPEYSSKPDWFNLKKLGEGYLTLRKNEPDNPNWDRILYFSKDSTYAFYCDMFD